MKTLTKYTLILLATLSVSGCFSEDDKSYVDTYETPQEASQEGLEIIADMECWYGGGTEPSHHFEVVSGHRSGNVYKIRTSSGEQHESLTLCRLVYR